jgi:predicted TPR repeat methyltransferase
MPDQHQNRVQWVYSSKNNSELTKRYDEWSKDYDKDLTEDFGWTAPKTAADFLVKHIRPDSIVLDAGAGTGLVGMVLAAHGFQNITGMDMSKGMLEQAGRKGVYAQLDQMTLGESLEYDSDTFDAVISVGVMTLGHAAPESFDELVRITKPNGFIVFTIRTDVYLNNGFKEKQEEMAMKKFWGMIEVSEEFQPLPVGEPDVKHQVWVYQVLDY